MAFKTKRISDLPASQSWSGLKTIGVHTNENGETESVQVSLDELENAVAEINDATEQATQAAASANSAAGQAQTATSEAQTATEEAQTATSEAQTATSEANQAVQDMAEEFAKKQNLADAVGKKTAEGGEVFNNETNVASGLNSHAEGGEDIKTRLFETAELIKSGFADLTITDDSNGYVFDNTMIAFVLMYGKTAGATKILFIIKGTKYEVQSIDESNYAIKFVEPFPYHTGDVFKVTEYNIEYIVDDSCRALGLSSHAEGFQTTAHGNYGSHAEGAYTSAQGRASHAEGGAFTMVNGSSAIIPCEEDFPQPTETPNQAIGDCSHSEGCQTIAMGTASHAEGYGALAFGHSSHAEGHGDSFPYGLLFNGKEITQATAEDILLEWKNSSNIKFSCAAGHSSHTEGEKSMAYGQSSHAEGQLTLASGSSAHAEGSSTTATGVCSHAEGLLTTAWSAESHAEGYSTNATGESSHAEGEGTQTSNQAEHAEGKYNQSHEGTQSSIGIGASDNARKNAVEVMDDGRQFLYGVGGYDGTNPDTAQDVKTVIDGLIARIAALEAK